MVFSFTDGQMKFIDHSAESRAGIMAIVHLRKYVHSGGKRSEKKLVRTEDNDKVQGCMIDGLCRGHISRRDRKELAVRTSSSLATMGSYKYWDRTHLIGPDSSMWIRTRRGSRI